jgi:hypothetical protein
MKKNILLLFVFIIIINLDIKAQDIAMITTPKMKTYEKAPAKLVPLIKEAHYSYEYMGSEVLVSFIGDEHIEYYENKKYYIKSKVKWISSDECYITIQESTLPDFPFKMGATLHLKILKMKDGKVIYQSTLGRRSWKGKMKAL